MKTEVSKISLSLMFAVSVAALMTGCNRPENAAGTAVASPATPGTQLDDTVITARVKTALMADQDIKGFDIKVETRKGTVLLSGFVDSLSQVDRAVAATRLVEGVQGIENGMTLKGGSATVGTQLDDGIVTTRVKAALLAESTIPSTQIAVATRKGEVQLSGFVDSQVQIDRAIALTKLVEGVQSVTNEMSVKK